MAKPVRALLDLICSRKVDWQGVEWLQESLRIDDETLQQITSADFQTLQLVYKHKRVAHFLDMLAMSVQQ